MGKASAVALISGLCFQPAIAAAEVGRNLDLHPHEANAQGRAYFFLGARWEPTTWIEYGSDPMGSLIPGLGVERRIFSQQRLAGGARLGLELSRGQQWVPLRDANDDPVLARALRVGLLIGLHARTHFVGPLDAGLGLDIVPRWLHTSTPPEALGNTFAAGFYLYGSLPLRIGGFHSLTPEVGVTADAIPISITEMRRGVGPSVALVYRYWPEGMLELRLEER